MKRKIQNDIDLKEKSVDEAGIIVKDNITSMQRSVFSDIITYDKVIDNKIDLIRKMSFKKLTKLIKEIDFKNRSKLIALSNNKEQ